MKIYPSRVFDANIRNRVSHKILLCSRRNFNPLTTYTIANEIEIECTVLFQTLERNNILTGFTFRRTVRKTNRNLR